MTYRQLKRLVPCTVELSNGRVLTIKDPDEITKGVGGTVKVALSHSTKAGVYFVDPNSIVYVWRCSSDDRGT